MARERIDWFCDYVVPPEADDVGGRQLVTKAARMLESDTDLVLSSANERVCLAPSLVEVLRHALDRLNRGFGVEIDGCNIVRRLPDAARFIRVNEEELDELIAEGVFEVVPDPYSPRGLTCEPEATVRLADLYAYREKVKAESAAEAKRYLDETRESRLRERAEREAWVAENVPVLEEDVEWFAKKWQAEERQAQEEQAQ